MNWDIWNPGMSCNVKLVPLEWEKNACLSSLQTPLSQNDQSCTDAVFFIFIQGFSVSQPCVMRGVCSASPLVLQQSLAIFSPVRRIETVIPEKTKESFCQMQIKCCPGLNCCKPEWTLGDSIGQESVCFLLFMLSLYLPLSLSPFISFISLYLPFSLNDKAPLASYLSNWCNGHPFSIWPNQF